MPNPQHAKLLLHGFSGKQNGVTAPRVGQHSFDLNRLGEGVGTKGHEVHIEGGGNLRIYAQPEVIPLQIELAVHRRRLQHPQGDSCTDSCRLDRRTTLRAKVMNQSRVFRAAKIST